MPINKARGKQDSRQGQKTKIATEFRGWRKDQYGHRIYSVQGVGTRGPVLGLNNKGVYADGIERFKGTAKACIEYCKSHRNKSYVIVALTNPKKR